MGVHVDFQKRQIFASVRDLVQPPQDGVRGIGIIARLRAELGQSAHRTYRLECEEQTPDYQGEVAIDGSFRIDKFDVRLSGRIDGLVEDETGTLVEEVKSVTHGGAVLEQLPLEAIPDYALQVRLYALLMSRSRPRTTIRPRLVLISIMDGSRRTMEVPYDKRSTDRELRGLIRNVIAEAQAERTRAAEMSAAADKLNFPYREFRPNQQDLIDSIASGLSADQPVLIMAPTGSGKTVSALLAGLRYSMSHAATLFFATSKNTQQELAARTFLDLCEAARLDPAAISSVTLRAKERMCPTGSLMCHPELCLYLTDFRQRLAQSDVVDQLLGSHRHIGPDFVYEEGKALDLCPFQLSLALASRADLVIADYNYAFDPVVSLGSFSDTPGRRPTVVIIDEAHNLFDRARDYYSPFIDIASVNRAMQHVDSVLNNTAPPRVPQQTLFGMPEPVIAKKDLFSEVLAFLQEIGKRVEIAYRTAREEEREFIADCAVLEENAGCWSKYAHRAAKLILQYALYNKQQQQVHPHDPLTDLLGRVLRMQDILAEDRPEFVHFVGGPQALPGPGEGVLCVNPARQLAARHQTVKGSVAMSATFIPLSYFSEVLGFAALTPRTVHVASPFPREHRLVKIVPGVDTTYRRREGQLGQIATLIAGVLKVRPGNYVAYFPSFSLLQQVRERLELPPKELLVQGPSMSEAERQSVLLRLREHDGPQLLLAVAGGVFAEGIDLPGKGLIGAIIVGPALPAVGFEREMMRRYFEEANGQGFEYAMLYPGMQRVIQSAGRVIRTMEDRGVIILLGRRFATYPYARSLPEEWYRHDPQELITDTLVADVADFWSPVL